MTDAVTKSWIFDAADELAVRNGCWFDPLAGAYTVWWIERYCRLYEGDFAGDPMHLRGRHDEKIDAWEIPEEFDEQLALERHEHFISGRLSGVDCDWQYYAIMRLFGWQRYSERWDRNIRRFRKASWWVPKKNKKSPTLAAIGLYLTCGDGEPGQKVAFLAKDGAQAREIAGKHALEMVKASPELSEPGVCKINHNECMVEHLPTRSFIKPFSSSNARNKEAKEGFNGSLLVDETHVVDRDFMKRMKRAGISRSEFIHLEVSTAGNNPDGYGKERFDYGAEVASGKVENDELCYVAYSAPQDIDAGSLTEDEVIRVGKIANPAWGHTIGKEEFLSDWNESKSRTTEMLDFAMYRLDVWQSSVNTWLPIHAWDECGHDFALPELYGRECAIGLDLSRTRDMTAAVLAFPEYGEDGVESVILWPHFWLPEAYANKHKNDADFLGWHKAGFLQLTDGNEISTGEIYETVEQWNRLFAVKGLFYDPAFATPITQLIEQGLMNSEKKMLVEPLSIERYPINQAGVEMALAIDEFESRVRNGGIRHPRNRVLDWQVGNAQVRQKVGKPVIEKPHRDSVKKIDGIVASLMAVHGALAAAAGVVHTACGLHVFSGAGEPSRQRQEWFDDDE